MNYIIIIALKAKKQIDVLPPKTKDKIGNVIKELSLSPYTGKALKAKLKGLYSYRVGSYRIIYDIIEKKIIIEVLKVMHRKDVYR
ncbi:MAG: type II toxin-antitoxin system mRNA interferase toxin, RelE/StbE family [Candidatus Omnitrophica bacterium]|nr:type II toxin-antitoxin system mRNA interferase toxin, RelE/StbE family [Candidatus Omnitrophota bacterium]